MACRWQVMSATCQIFESEHWASSTVNRNHGKMKMNKSSAVSWCACECLASGCRWNPIFWLYVPLLHHWLATASAGNHGKRPTKRKKKNVDEFSCASVSRQMSQHGHVYVLVTNRQWFNGSSWRCECDGMWAGWTNLRIRELSEMEIMFFCGSIVRQTKRCEIYWANAIGVNVCQINIDTKTMLHSRRWWTSSERTLNLCEERNA